jgi:2-succinyl-5-enolpyruvyl-6-hydroxy-3-cyclohexene-1-carboxylate synthase
VSSAFGAAAATGAPVVLLIGDVALAYDIGGLLAHRRLGLDLTIVLLDNQGGGIFDFLPVGRSQTARHDDVYTQHIATPTGLDFAKAAELYGFGHERVQDVVAFRAALEQSFEDGAERGANIIEVRTERAANVELHALLWKAVSEAL